ncbi:MAG TPA: multicopper oxidase family protein [Casimicrobiaceae bacterium]|jgi:bilirubin oxidase|nr:multicopper oxidase family protein [Casimicrobiaceae bacterium]
MSGSSVSDYALLEGQPLLSLQILRNENATPGQFSALLSAAPAPEMLNPGAGTPMWLYNAFYPSPLIELAEGQHVAITIDNGLPQDTTIHWHGLTVPANQDGNPMDPVPAGASHLYEFDVPPGSAGTYWYHPHPHLNTAEQVARGLAGPLIVRSREDPLAHIPEITLFITGVRLDSNAEISADNAIDWTVGRQNELLLVNGGRLPVHRVGPGATQRWRILNATAARHFRLALEGHTLTLVGTDGGLLGAPIAGLTEILVAPAQRVEIVVTVNATPNARYRLQALQYETDYLGLGSYADVDLLTLATSADPGAAPLVIPSSLRPIADLGVASTSQRVELSEVTGLCTRSGATVTFLINGRVFDPNRVDLVTAVGRVELWEIVNNTAMAHPFHIHGTQFQLVSRQIGRVVTPAPYLAWIDTVLIPSQHTATIKVRQMLPGKRMFHCHILEHEDNCMMALLDVQPP